MPVYKTYKTPGVHIEENDAFPMSVVGIDTAIPVFIGKVAETPENEPVLINTLAEYVDKFGKAKPQSFEAKIKIDPDDSNRAVLESVEATSNKEINLFYQMQMFFANGGSTCYVMAVDEYPTGDYEKFLQPLATKDDITMVVLADIASNDSQIYTELCNKALDQCKDLNRFLLIDMSYNSDYKTIDFRENLGNEGLKYGAAYTPYLNTSLGYIYSDESITLTGDGLAQLNEGASLTAGSSTLCDISNTNTQLYNQVRAAVANIKVDNLPPSGAMAGIYAKVDKERGVWMAPANFILNSVIAPAAEITAEEQESLNIDPHSGKSINAIRNFPGKGNLVWGARTLDGNSNDWRYISVRRTVSYVERSLSNALQAYVFESNNEMTWLKVSTMINTFLNNLWQQGGLAGSSASDAYFVNLGLGTTMTSQDILEGQMKISIGLAVVRPAEFIILDVTQMLQK